MKVKQLIIVLLLTASVIAVNAMPARPGIRRVLTLADGTSVRAQLTGDEHGHYWLGEDGKAYLGAENSKVFLPVSKDLMQSKGNARRTKANRMRMKNLSPKLTSATNGYMGERKGLVILVNFKDVSFSEENDKALFHRITNEKGFAEGDFQGSVRDYFYDQSQGKFDLTFDIVGPVTLSRNMKYYGQNTSSGDDRYVGKMVTEVLELVDDQVDFSRYDWSGDGQVEQFVIIYAGYGEQDGGSSETVWAHEWTLSEAQLYNDGNGPQVLDGVVVDTYACCQELDYITKKVAGIGTICHEFGHCLGFPDFYNTEYSGGWGMDCWDLMDYGAYNCNGFVPAGFSTWERWETGWKEPIELSEEMEVTDMKPLQDDGDGYIIYNHSNPNEYFIFENRQQTQWDQGLPGSGMLILHVDYDEDAWYSNTVNNDPKLQRMTWVAADNEYQVKGRGLSTYLSEKGLANDLFPYNNVTAFNGTSNPAALFHNKNNDNSYGTDFSVEDITRNDDGTIAFKVRKRLQTPVFSPAPDSYEEPQNVTISCEEEGAVIYYTLDGTTPTTDSKVYTEPINVDKAVTIKAMAVHDDKESNVAEAIYLYTDIRMVETDHSFGKTYTYNLHGQRIDNPGKGIYVINGKKRIVK